MSLTKNYNSKEKTSNLILVIKCKGTDNIIGLKEDIAMRLEGVVGIERIDVKEGEDWLKSNG